MKGEAQHCKGMGGGDDPWSVASFQMGVLHDSTTPLCNPLDGSMEGDTLPTGTLPPTCMPTCRPFAVWLILIGDSFFFFFPHLSISRSKSSHAA